MHVIEPAKLLAAARFELARKRVANLAHLAGLAVGGAVEDLAQVDGRCFGKLRHALLGANLFHKQAEIVKPDFSNSFHNRIESAPLFFWNERRAYTTAMRLNDYLSQRGQKSELARAIGVPAILISQWSLGQRPVPPARCKAIEAATDGAVTCRDLRPDDWQKFWPELADIQATA